MRERKMIIPVSVVVVMGIFSISLFNTFHHRSYPLPFSEGVNAAIIYLISPEIVEINNLLDSIALLRANAKFVQKYPIITSICDSRTRHTDLLLKAMCLLKDTHAVLHSTPEWQ